MRSQHPRHFFVRFHNTGDEIAGTCIMQFIGKAIDVLAQEKSELSKLDELESEIAKELGATKQKD